ncbi:hypothetical protein GCM10029964_070300 [Kibdelosporangium lantanae]
MVDSALDAYGRVAHHGLSRVALDSVAADLRRIGLRATADRVTAFAAMPTAGTWFASHVRLLTLVA